MFWINCMPFVFIGDVLTPHSTTADGLSAHCLLTNSACCVKCVLDGLELWYNIRDCYPAAGELPSHLQPCSMFCCDLKLTGLVCMPTSVYFYAFMLNIWLLELSCPSHQNEQLLQVCCMDSTMRDCFPEPWWHWTQVTALLPVQDFRNLLWSQCLRTGHCHSHQPLSAGSPPIPCPLKAAVRLFSALGILSSMSSWITNTLCMPFQMLLVRMLGCNHCKE